MKLRWQSQHSIKVGATRKRDGRVTDGGNSRIEGNQRKQKPNDEEKSLYKRACIWAVIYI